MATPPEKIGRYEVIELIGKGAMGVVYKARDPNIDRVVAIKAVKTSEILDTPEGEELIQRFKREVQTAGTLTHANIVTIYDGGTDGELHWIAMEYVDGPNLEQINSDRIVLPLHDILAIFVKVCSAVDFAHRRGIIHRDLKPANIMLTQDWEPKIADFGIARVSSSTMTRTGIILGTPSYMSPEQITGQQLDTRSDIFSLGIVLYELITGERPFLGDNPTTIMYKIVHSEPLEPATVNLTLPKGLSAIVMKALAKSPKDRYQTAGRVASDLINLVKNTPELSASTSRLDMPTAILSTGEISDSFDRYQSVTAPRAGKRRAPVLLMVFLLVVIVGVVVGGVYLLSQSGGSGGGAGPLPATAIEGEAAAQEVTKLIGIAGPEGAAIYVDGELRQETLPAQIGITRPAGARITLRLESGCLEAEEVVEFEDGEDFQWDGQMRPRSGEFRVTSEPEGAVIRIGGEERGRTPATLEIECGAEVALVASGYRSAGRTLSAGDFESGEPLVFTLERIPTGTVSFVLPQVFEGQIRERFRLAVLRENGSTLRRDARSVQLPVGTHRLRLVNPELFLNWTTPPIEVREGRTQAVTVPMGILRVFARPMDCEVVVNGNRLGRVLPIQGRPVAAGTYRITFIWGDVERTETVEVRSGEAAVARGIQRP